jgi:hypothetical protein
MNLLIISGIKMYRKLPSFLTWPYKKIKIS